MWPWSSPPYPTVSLDELHAEYDYIIVGGGTAGCVLANRLSAVPGKTVLLIERGPLGHTWKSRVPLISTDFASNRALSRLLETEPQPELNNKVFEWVQGTGLGGCSRINGMIYTRGLPKEYDLWAESGCEGWAWRDVEPFFRKSENFLDGHDEENVHGKTGEWTVRGDPLCFPGHSSVVDACKILGLPYFEDVNLPGNPTSFIGKMHFTRDKKQYRGSTDRAFLPANLVRGRENLHIATDAIGAKLIIGMRGEVPFVEGVEIVDRSNKKKKIVKCGHEVIVCAGAFGSPQLLMLSGIGHAAYLEGHHIPVYKNLPAVGNNLQDHFAVSTAFTVPMSHSLLSFQKQPWTMVVQFLLWFIWSAGMLLSPVVQTIIFLSSASLDARGHPIKNENHSDVLPDIEIIPVAYDSCDSFKLSDTSRGTYSFLSVLLRPKSKGRILLTSTEPDAPLKIDCQYFSNPDDFIPLRAALRFVLRLRESLRKNGYPIEDRKSAMPEGEDDESLDKFIRWRNRTAYHYTSTCRMGPSQDAPDGGAVVDAQLRVFGVAGLRVADTSVFPWMSAVHPQAAVVMIAEKCAHMILHPKRE